MASILQSINVKSIEQIQNNQLVITLSDGTKTFVSYGTVIATKKDNQIILDQYYWDYSRTTLKYLNQFLGTASKKDILQGIKQGLYKLDNLQ